MADPAAVPVPGPPARRLLPDSWRPLPDGRAELLYYEALGLYGYDHAVCTVHVLTAT
jgi:hypothetical protein